MNKFQAQELNTSEFVTRYIHATLERQGEYEMLTGLFELHEYWRSAERETFIPRVLFDFYANQQSTAGANLDLQEIQAGLNFRPVLDLWKSFISLASEEGSYPSLEEPMQRRSLRQAKVMYANLLRRSSRFGEAQQILESALEQIGEDEKRGDEILLNVGFLHYENGYLSYLQGNYADAIASFQKSSEIDFGRGDEVGGGISACVEFRFRYLTGGCTDHEFSGLLARMSEVFKRNSVPEVAKHGHARRWVWNCGGHQLEVAYDSANKELAETAIREVRNNKHVQPDESFMKLYDGIHALTLEAFDSAVEFLTGAWEMRAPPEDKMRFTAPEAQSQMPYYIGKAHGGAGNLAEARKYLTIGAELSENPGNHIWKARSQSALRLLDFK